MSRRNDIDIRAGVEGVEKTKRDLGKIRESTRKVGSEADKTGKKTERAGGKMSGALAGLKSQLGGFIGGFIGVGSLIAGIMKSARLEADSLKETLELVRQRLEAIKDLQFLGDFAKQHPNVYKDLDEMALQYHMGARGPTQLARAYESIVSKMPAATKDQRLGILREAAQYTQTTRTGVGTLADMLIFAQKAAPGATPNQLQNLIQLGITEAGSSMEAMAQYLPRILGLGQASGLSMPETFGLYAGATGVFPEPSVATTGLSTMLAALQQGNVSPEAQRVRRRVGLKAGMPVMSQLGALHQASMAGKLSMADYNALFGREGMRLAANLIPQMPAVQASITNLQAYNQPGLDIVGQKAGEYYAPGTTQARQQIIEDLGLLEELAQLESETEEAQLEKMQRDLGDVLSRRAGQPAWLRGLLRGIVWTGQHANPWAGADAAREGIELMTENELLTDTERASIRRGAGIVDNRGSIQIHHHLDRGASPAQTGQPLMPHTE